jgi:protein-disulfide isomerase
VEPTLRDKYIKAGQVRWVFKFAEPSQGGAPNAAAASLCALDQGKFWEYRDALYAQQSEWKDEDKAALTGYAKTLGLDEAKFTKCLNDAPFQTQFDSDIAIAQQQIGVDRLPYFLLLNPTKQSGTRLPGAVSIADIDKVVDQLLNPPPTPASQPIQPKN